MGTNYVRKMERETEVHIVRCIYSCSKIQFGQKESGSENKEKLKWTSATAYTSN